MHQPDASAANRALELLGRELNLFTEKKDVGKPGDFDDMADDHLQLVEYKIGENSREAGRANLRHINYGRTSLSYPVQPDTRVRRCR